MRTKTLLNRQGSVVLSWDDTFSKLVEESIRWGGDNEAHPRVEVAMTTAIPALEGYGSKLSLAAVE